MKINTPLLVIGLVLALAAFGGILFAGRLLNPAPVQVPVAIADIAAGEALTQAQFRLEEWSGIRGETLQALYLPGDFPVGALALSDIPAGSPLYKAYVDTTHSADFVTRLSNLVKDKGLLVMAVPVEPDTGGNVPKPGDQVDMVFSVGIVRQNAVQSHPTSTPLPPVFGRAVTGTLSASQTGTETLSLPLSALVLQNVPVLTVEYKQVTTASGYGADGESTATVVRGDAERVYVAVTRDQAEVLGFLLHNGDVLLAVHQAGMGERYPGGITWEDFEAFFFEVRPTPTPSAPVPGGQNGR